MCLPLFVARLNFSPQLRLSIGVDEMQEIGRPVALLINLLGRFDSCARQELSDLRTRKRLVSLYRALKDAYSRLHLNRRICNRAMSAKKILSDLSVPSILRRAQPRGFF